VVKLRVVKHQESLFTSWQQLYWQNLSDAITRELKSEDLELPGEDGKSVNFGQFQLFALQQLSISSPQGLQTQLFQE
jgi:hypothetical protein